ncbi:hypothetical protein QBC46DRAFT_373984 [Diplogelasinospora grovesii]|uniref:Serine/threonine-protein kinase ppk6 n=1 Tax=Diplogelasinospora grovesii TaxID=303347 RepID=A0AAN6NH05_9PEZI|nr:hypothetical protein QBC46DRAFT_373984 [Diplogelasinospora grovesii]
MSADLFAAFENPPQSSGTQQNPSQSGGGPQPDDPFSFLTSSFPAPKPQTSQQTSAWPTLQQPTTASPASAWPAPQFQYNAQNVSAQAHNASVWGDLAGLGATQSGSPFAVQKPAEEEDDDWGDFEGPATSTRAQQPVLPSTTNLYNPPAVSATTTQPPVRTRVIRASTLDMMNNRLVDIGGTSSTQVPRHEAPSWGAPTKKERPQKKPTNTNADVLFDADDFDGQDIAEEDDDDFGDFEGGTTVTVAPRAAPPKPAPSLDLLSLDSISSSPAQTKKQPPGLLLSSLSPTDNALPYPQAPKSPYGSFQNRKPAAMKELKVKTPLGEEFPVEVKQQSPSPVTAWPSVEQRDPEREEWAAFEDLPDTKPTRSKAASTQKPTAQQTASEWDWGNDWDSAAQETQPKATAAGTNSLPSDASGPPPTNVPPPSILLSIFPQLLDLANTSLLKPISAQPASVQDRVLSDEATLIFLRCYLTLATVAARIIAGRKLRWHRDKLLMQKMSISAAGGKGGMKLAGVDKQQSAHEDREAAEVVDVWKKQVGRLRSAVAAANRAASTDLKVPELAVTVAVQTAKGALTAPKPCVICGLKRDERIPKVDYLMEDSFGEWWVEFWGHRACRNFWLEHEVKLRSR